MGRVTEFAEKIWNGDEGFEMGSHPLAVFLGFEELAGGLGFVSSFSNVTILDTPEGLVLIDTGAAFFAGNVHQQIRAWTKAPLHTAVYTHGHVDHVFGVTPFEAEPGAARARVIAHAAVAARFDRYKLTAGYNSVINARQFQTPGVKFPTEYRYPDETLTDRRTVEVGGERVELFHDKGETDDHVWAYLPARKVLCTGDLFIWAAPNCGNPQKVQRFPREWAVALRKMEQLGAETLLPGHGPPIFGAARVRQALGDTAALLETVHDQALAMMNDGARLDDILHGVRIPDDLLARPYLRPVYDDPAFIIRNVWRLYGGWYDGNPAHLKPAPDAALAQELAALAGGAGALAARAAVLVDAGELALAAHLAELARHAAPDDGDVRAVYRKVYEARAAAEPSLMARAIYKDAASRGS